MTRDEANFQNWEGGGGGESGIQAVPRNEMLVLLRSLVSLIRAFQIVRAGFEQGLFRERFRKTSFGAPVRICTSAWHANFRQVLA